MLNGNMYESKILFCYAAQDGSNYYYYFFYSYARVFFPLFDAGHFLMAWYAKSLYTVQLALVLFSLSLWHSAIKERALAKHKSSVAHASQGPKELPSSIKRPGTGKKWKTVYSKYKGSEAQLQAYQAKEMLNLERNANTATASNLHSSTTVVTFPGFANLGTIKDQTFNKHSSNNNDMVDTPIVPLQMDNEVPKRVHEIRSGYLMPDEELLQKWTNSSWSCICLSSCSWQSQVQILTIIMIIIAKGHHQYRYHNQNTDMECDLYQ